jgi:hypothetical protein
MIVPAGMMEFVAVLFSKKAERITYAMCVFTQVQSTNVRGLVSCTHRCFVLCVRENRFGF